MTKRREIPPFLHFFAFIFLKAIDIYTFIVYNKSIGGRDMKTKDLIALLEKNGWKFKRHGANHDIYVKGKERESVVRHRETDEELARAIIRRRGLQ